MQSMTLIQREGEASPTAEQLTAMRSSSAFHVSSPTPAKLGRAVLVMREGVVHAQTSSDSEA